MGDNRKLSPFMLEAIALAKEGGGKLVRIPGGYWMIEGGARHGNGVPVRYAIAVTVEALVQRGIATYTKIKWKRGNQVETEITLTEKTI